MNFLDIYLNFSIINIQNFIITINLNYIFLQILYGLQILII